MVASWPGGTNTTGTTCGDGVEPHGAHAGIAGCAGPGDGEPAEQARGHVVRVALELVASDERSLVVQRLVATERQRPGRDDPGDDRRGRRAEPAAVRDPVGAAELEAPRLATEPGEASPASPGRRGVARRVGTVVGTLARDVDGEAARR